MIDEAKKEAVEIKATVEKLVKDFNWKYPELALSVTAESDLTQAYGKFGVVNIFEVKCSYVLTVN
jgi:hypothetical protein